MKVYLVMSRKAVIPAMGYALQQVCLHQVTSIEMLFVADVLATSSPTTLPSKADRAEI
jgi:hypothetical protein